MESSIRYVTQDEFRGHEKIAEDRFGRDKKQLEKHDDAIDRLVRLNERMQVMLERHDDVVRVHEERLNVLERQPGDNWSKVKTAITTAIVTLFVTGIGGAILASILMTK